MRLVPPSKLPIGCLEFIEKQIFYPCPFFYLANLWFFYTKLEAKWCIKWEFSSFKFAYICSEIISTQSDWSFISAIKIRNANCFSSSQKFDSNLNFVPFYNDYILKLQNSTFFAPLLKFCLKCWIELKNEVCLKSWATINVL